VGNYYYFVAQLPYVNYGDVPPMSTGYFLELCQALLKPADFALTRYCTLDAKVAIETAASTGSAFVDDWLARERTLWLNLAALRAGKLHRPIPADPPHDAPRAEAVAKAAFAMDDPLQAELYIDRARWGAVEAMIGMNYFSVNTIFAYIIKLQLLERKQLFKTDEGFSEYKTLYAAIMAASKSTVNGDITGNKTGVTA
jgi:hypothetical protein